MTAQSELEELIKPGVLDGLEDWPVDRVRELRDACRAAEVRVSYERRVAQGRLDIARAEQARRPARAARGAGQSTTGIPGTEASGTEPAGGERGDLVAALPGILADRPSGAPKSDRAVGLIDPADDDLDEIPAILDLPDLSDEDVAALIAALEESERRLSEQRRQLLTNLDRLQDELVVRYRDARADVSEVLGRDAPTGD